jgi:hypothetical protein
MRAAKLTVALLAVLSISALGAAGAQAEFGIAEFSVSSLRQGGGVDMRAGSHPYGLRIQLEMNQDADGQPEGTLRQLIVNLPPGLIGNPQAAPRCPMTDFDGPVARCPGTTQIGVIHLDFAVGGELRELDAPVYNLTPPAGVAASFGFSALNKNSFQEASLRTGSDYGATVSDITVPTDPLEILSATETIWGVPADPSHDDARFCLEDDGDFVEGCETEQPLLPFLRLPTSCTGPLALTMSVSSVQEPSVSVAAETKLEGEGGTPEGLHACDVPPFSPTIEARAQTAAADSPTGLHVRLHLPQNQDPGGFGAADLKDSTVTLPAGVAVNPSAANGLGACSQAQIDLHGSGPANCPADSKVGTVTIHTPLLDHPVSGAVYLAKQGDNPFGSLIALYIAVYDPITGVVIKLAGKAEPDPVSGQLSATFANNPQLPFEDLEVDFNGGPRATLTTPPLCGSYTTQTSLVPWTSPEGATVHPSDSFPISSGASGGPCAASEAALPATPAFEAGTTNPLAGSYSPFVLKLSRDNGTQRIAAINATLPLGFTGKLAGVPYCPEAQIAAAAARSNPGEGALEQANPSCPAASRVGTATVGAGSGTPIYVQGSAYLAGPYKGAPLSMVIITPAVAGPFDLGVVAVRTALYVNEETAQITAKSDPIPTILRGIPLDVRSIALQLDRSQFTLNPTSCEAKSIAGTLTTTAGQSVPFQNRFQVGGCGGLGFAPKLALSLKGPTKRTGHPALTAILTYPTKGRYANIARAQVSLPPAEFIDQGNFDKVCTQAQLRSATCPKGAVYGRAKAWVPLLDRPLEGPVYLGVGYGHQLPDLVVDLSGQLRILLHGRVDTTKKQGLRNTFEVVPDAPVSRFELRMKGGKRYGLLVNSENICAKAQRANAKFVAQNNKVAQLHPLVANSCHPPKGK